MINQNSRSGFVNNYELKDKELEWARKYLGLDHIPGSVDITDEDPGVNISDSYRFKIKENILDVKNYDYAISVNGADTDLTTFKGIKFSHNILDYKFLTLIVGNEKVSFQDDSLANGLLNRKDINSYLLKSNNNSEKCYLLPQELLTSTKQTSSYIVSLIIDNLEVGKTQKGIKPMYVAGTYLVKKKK